MGILFRISLTVWGTVLFELCQHTPLILIWSTDVMNNYDFEMSWGMKYVSSLIPVSLLLTVTDRTLFPVKTEQVAAGTTQCRCRWCRWSGGSCTLVESFDKKRAVQKDVTVNRRFSNVGELTRLRSLVLRESTLWRCKWLLLLQVGAEWPKKPEAVGYLQSDNLQI